MGITLTDAAAEKIRSLFSRHHLDKAGGLRIFLTGEEKTGFTYRLDVSPEPAEEDAVFESHGVRVFVAPKDLPYLDGLEIDYNRQWLKGGFEFHLPRASHVCHCGCSFSVDSEGSCGSSCGDCRSSR